MAEEVRYVPTLDIQDFNPMCFHDHRYAFAMCKCICLETPWFAALCVFALIGWCTVCYFFCERCSPLRSRIEASYSDASEGFMSADDAGN